MSRSLKKPLFTLALKNPRLFNKFIKANQEKKHLVMKLWSRSVVIDPEMIGHTLLIHNGKKFLSRTVTQEMVGYRIGMFAPTRRSGKHGKAGTH